MLPKASDEQLLALLPTTGIRPDLPARQDHAQAAICLYVFCGKLTDSGNGRIYSLI